MVVKVKVDHRAPMVMHAPGDRCVTISDAILARYACVKSEEMKLRGLKKDNALVWFGLLDQAS
jgi:hypothetical protein